MSEVNPFEPWRPKDFGGGGEDVYPWRTPSREQGLPDDEDRNVPHYERRSGRAVEGDGRVPPPSGANSFCVLLLIALIITTLIGAGVSGGNHFGRYAVAAACLWVGVFFGLSVLHRSGWLARLGTLAVGVAASAACWMLVPTTGGLSWWAARGRMQALADLRSGDLAGFAATQAERTQMAKEFPTWAKDVARAEQKWMRASAGRITSEAETLARENAVKALDHLAEVERSLSGSQHRSAIQSEMDSAWKRAAEARADQIATEANALADKGLYARAHALAAAEGEVLQKRLARQGGAAQVARDKIMSSRRLLINRHVKDGVEQLESLLEKKQYMAVAAEGRRLAADLEEAARPLGRHDEVKARLLPARRKAVEARMSMVHGAATEHLDRNEPDKAATAIIDGLRGLEDEATGIGTMGDLLAGLVPLRRRVLGLRIGRAAKATEALLAKKEHEAAGVKCRAAMDELAGEARLVGEMPTLTNAIMPLRRKAWAGRLDAAREELRALLVKDEFEAAGPLGERVGRALAAEAAALDSQRELNEFTSRCRAIARLAAAAKKKE